MMTTPKAARNEDGEALRELAGLRARLDAIEALLVGFYGPNALGSKPAPAAPPPAPQRTSRPIATLGGPFFSR
jgi:hypothetical protein